MIHNLLGLYVKIMTNLCHSQIVMQKSTGHQQSLAPSYQTLQDIVILYNVYNGFTGIFLYRTSW
jgi:hypothetical protein